MKIFLCCIALAWISSTDRVRAQGDRNGARFTQAGPKPGAAAPDFTLQTLDGKTVRGSELWSGKPLLLMTGSYTCPVFRNHAPAFERLVREFGDKLNFLVLYTLEAHPKGDASPYSDREWVTPANEKEGVIFPQPKTTADRLALAKKCVASVKLDGAVAIDTMENATWKAYGGAPNCAYLIDTRGKVAAQHGWFNGDTMAGSIRALLKAR